MAVARLGALITQLAGSIGGTTIRRSGGNLVMYNKPNGLSLNKLRANVRLPLLTSANKGWGMVPQNEREQFEQISRSVQFPDRFGNMRFITPRQVFNKSAGRLIVYQLPIPNWLEWQYSTPIVNIGSIRANLSGGEFAFTLAGGSENGFMLIYAEFRTTPFNAPVFEGSRLTAIVPFDGADTYDFTNEVLTQNPGIQVGMLVRYYFRPLSIYGFPGNWQYLDGVVT